MSSICTANAQDAALPQFQLRDFIARDWTNELVSYPVADSVSGRNDLALIGPGGKAVPYQWRLSEEGKKTILFQANVPKNATVSYKLQNGAPAAATDLKVEEDAQILRITNGRTGIALRKVLVGSAGPISGVRLESGTWVGESQVKLAAPVDKYSVRLLAAGPVQAEALCELALRDGTAWRMRVRLQAGEPVVLVTESYNLKADATWNLDLSANFSPNKLFARYGRTTEGQTHGVGELARWNVPDVGDTQPVFFLEPWLHWSARDREGNWFGLLRDDNPDLLAMGALRPAMWIDPKRQNRENGNVNVVAREGKLVADLPLVGGARAWMIGSFPRAESIKGIGANPGADPKAPLPQLSLIKHTDFPLDMVKDFQLTWAAPDPKRPCLLITSEDVARLKAPFKPDDALRDRLLNVQLSFFNIDPSIRYYLATGDEKIGRQLALAALDWTQGAVDMLVLQERQVTMGMAPHHMVSILAAVNLVDTAWNAMTPDERVRIKAQMALLGYTVMREDYSSVERGYHGLPNMITAVAAYRTGIGSFLSTHPQAKNWVTTGLQESKTQLAYWSDENGGWLEAPHYAMASYDFLTGQFLMAHNAGFDDTIFDPKMKKVAEWFAQIQTPRDARAGNKRHQPPIGDTWWNEPTGEFGIAARIWKERDPAFAARMQWMHRQQGSPEIPGTGGFGPALAGYRALLADATIVEKKPEWTSALFPQTGVMLRNGVGDRETQLHMIAGDHRSHYGDDSGSVTLWGKGRIIANDWGYLGGASKEHHNMIDSPAVGRMHVQTFATSKHFDYVSGTGNIWHRRILFVKDGDPLGPSYFVLRDTLDAPGSETWRLWCTANTVAVNGNSVLVDGRDDVDTDIYPANPEDLALGTETRVGEPMGQEDEQQFTKLKITQTALTAKATKGRRYGFLIFPRLKTQKPPTVTRLAGGKVFKVVTEAGTDYIMLGDEPFTFKQDGIDFQGISGLVKTRGTKSYLELGGGGRLSSGGNTITKAATPGVDGKEVLDILKYGDFEGDNIPVFTSSRYKVGVIDGNPVAGNTTHAGKRVLKVEYNPEGSGSGSVTLPLPIYVNSKTAYRISFDGYATEDMGVSIGGYVHTADKPGVNIVLPNTNVAGYGMDSKVTNKGWQHFEKVIESEDSDSKDKWYPGTASAGFGFWIGGNGTVYIDNLKMEPVEEKR